MIIWKWLWKQNLIVKIIGILLYLGLYLYLVDIILNAIINAKNGSTTIKRELCCVLAWNGLFLMCMLLDGDVSAEYFFYVTVLIYLPIFVLFHGLIYPIVNLIKRKNQEYELETKNYKGLSQIEEMIKGYFDKKDREFIKENFTVSKTIELSTCDFIIDTEHKTFSFFKPSCISTTYSNLVDDLIYKKFNLRELHKNKIDINNVQEEVYKELTSNTYDTCECNKIYNFRDLNRVELIDKSRTDEKRTYTMESKSGDAFWGAVAGSMLSETIFNEYATAGAVIGASGERNITENVERNTHIELSVTVYLNDINNPYETFTFTNENELREFIGALEYIKNNK